MAEFYTPGFKNKKSYHELSGPKHRRPGSAAEDNIQMCFDELRTNLHHSEPLAMLCKLMTTHPQGKCDAPSGLFLSTFYFEMLTLVYFLPFALSVINPIMFSHRLHHTKLCKPAWSCSFFITIRGFAIKFHIKLTNTGRCSSGGIVWISECHDASMNVEKRWWSS